MTVGGAPNRGEVPAPYQVRGRLFAGMTVGEVGMTVGEAPNRGEIPAFAGMTVWGAGMTVWGDAPNRGEVPAFAGMTVGEAGMTVGEAPSAP